MNNFYTWSNMESRRLKRYQIKNSILSKIFGAAYKIKLYVPMSKFGGEYQHQTGKVALITLAIGIIAMIPTIMLIAYFQQLL